MEVFVFCQHLDIVCDLLTEHKWKMLTLTEVWRDFGLGSSRLFTNPYKYGPKVGDLTRDYMDYEIYRSHRLRDIQGRDSYKYLVR